MLYMRCLKRSLTSSTVTKKLQIATNIGKSYTLRLLCEDCDIIKGKDISFLYLKSLLRWLSLRPSKNPPQTLTHECWIQRRKCTYHFARQQYVEWSSRKSKYDACLQELSFTKSTCNETTCTSKTTHHLLQQPYYPIYKQHPWTKLLRLNIKDFPGCSFQLCSEQQYWNKHTPKLCHCIVKFSDKKSKDEVARLIQNRGSDF